MNVLIVDTSVWVEYFRGEVTHNELELGLKEGRVYLPVIVVAELLSGKMASASQKKLYEFLEELPLCANDLAHWARVGHLRYELRSQGISVSTPDAHVAQCALDLDGYLLTKDKIFQKIAKAAKLRLL